MHFSFFPCCVQFIFLLSPAFAQLPKFYQLSGSEGLSQSTVNAILQDRFGFIWIGTQEGLNRYDGYSFTVFLHNPYDTTSISNNYITALFEDSSGRIWVGTNGGGINLYDRNVNQFTRIEHHSNKPGSISDNRVRAIIEDIIHHIWVGTDDGLNEIRNISGNNGFSIELYDTGTGKEALKSSAISSLYSDSKGRLWVGTNGSGLYLFQPEDRSFRSCSPSLSLVTGVNGTGNIRCITEDAENNLWIGTEGGTGIYNPADTSWEWYHSRMAAKETRLNNNKVLSVQQLTNGHIWAGTFGGGVNIYNPVDQSFSEIRSSATYPLALPDDFIRVIYEDRAASVWIGTNHGGIRVYHPQVVKFRHYNRNSGMPAGSNTVFALLEDRDENLWVGSSGGLFAMNRKTGTWKNFDTLASGAAGYAVLSLLQHSDGTIWVGTYGGGISSYDPKTGGITFYKPGKTNTVPGGTVTCLMEDPDRLIWTGTYGDGLAVLDPVTGSFSLPFDEPAFKSKNIYCIRTDRKGRIWIGTENDGMYMYMKDEKKIVHYERESSSQGLLANTINTIHEDDMGYLWLGTSGGLVRFNTSDGTFIYYHEKDGLPGDYVYGILSDHNENLWLSTNRGLSKMIIIDREKNLILFKNFNEDDGLQHNEFNQGAFYQNSHGEMFFGGINGFNGFFPDAIMDNPVPPPVYITSFKRFGREEKTDTVITTKSYIDLSWRDKFFSFEFVALNYIFPKKNLYSYKLEGFDEEWTPASERRYAGYTNIPGGDYVFRVRACNNDGIWNEQGARVHIHIRPPFWETRWFYSLCMVCALLLIYGFTKFRTYRIEREKKILKKAVEDRTRELAEKNQDILASIEYAERIQSALLPSLDIFSARFPESYIIYRPRDIVSGDFYWFYEKGGRTVVAAVDCTGHGVPGAFMSMIGHNLLNNIVIKNNILAPGEILRCLNREVQAALKQETHSDSQDGMDITVCTIMLDPMPAQPDIRAEVLFAGANNPLFIVRSSFSGHGSILSKNTLADETRIEMIDGEDYPIGGVQFSPDRSFKTHSVLFGKGDMLVMSTDGFIDQFGGQSGKKFMTKRFCRLLLQCCHLNAVEQKKMILNQFENWRDKESQVDDVLVIGIKF